MAIDVSWRAVALAKENARKVLGPGYEDRLEIRQQDVYSFNPGERFDLVVSNPPYIPTRYLKTLQPQVRRFESRLALDGGPDGTHMISYLLAQDWLTPTGELWLEVDSRHIHSLPGTKVKDCFGRYRFISIVTPPIT